MASVQWREEGGRLVITLAGKIDSSNAGDVEAQLNRARQEIPSDTVVIDCDGLEYASSVGLRLFLRIRKSGASLSLVNVHSTLYEILETTGFTEFLDVKKAYRMISVEGCEVVGEGANGKVYRIDPDTIVKVYLNPDSLPDIQRERELARTAFVLGVPTAIPYDVVRIRGGGYGSVFELLNAVSFAKLLVRGEKTVDEIAAMSAELLKTIHACEVEAGSMPDMRQVALGWAADLKPHLPANVYDRLHGLISDVPVNLHLMHGDFHVRNVMLQDGEALLIDMDTLCYGHPVFELASTYNAYCGYGIVDHAIISSFMGFPYETAHALWDRILELYIGTSDPAVLDSVERKAKIIGFTRIMRRTIRRKGLETEAGRALINRCAEILSDLVFVENTLVF